MVKNEWSQEITVTNMVDTRWLQSQETTLTTVVESKG